MLLPSPKNTSLGPISSNVLWLGSPSSFVIRRKRIQRKFVNLAGTEQDMSFAKVPVGYLKMSSVILKCIVQFKNTEVRVVLFFSFLMDPRLPCSACVDTFKRVPIASRSPALFAQMHGIDTPFVVQNFI